MPGFSDLLYDTVGKGVDFGFSHLHHHLGPGARERRRQRSLLPTLPALPAMPAYEAPAWPFAAPAAAAGAAAAQPSAVADSYAAEAEDVGVACRPCTLRHLATMHEAARAARAARGDARSEQAALVIAEALVWLEYDASPEALGRARPADREAVAPLVEPVRDLVAATPHAPDRVLLAWAAVLECQRFAESPRPGPRDHEHVARRTADTMGWIGYLESAERPALGDQVDRLRQARHPLAAHGPTPAALAESERHLRAAAGALTPPLDDGQADELVRRTAALRRDLFARAMASLGTARSARGHRAAAPSVRWYKDRETRLPEEMRGWLQAGRDPEAVSLAAARPSDLPAQGLLGATPQTVGAFLALLRFDQALGISDRERTMPSTWDGAILGSYSPELNVILLASSVEAMDNFALNTLVHENAHALLHGPRCLRHRTPSQEYQDEYEDTIEEREADLAQLLVFTRAGLPLELSDGSTLPPGRWHLTPERLRAETDDLTARRVTWAAGVILAAMQKGAAAAPLAASCPPR